MYAIKVLPFEKSIAFKRYHVLKFSSLIRNVPNKSWNMFLRPPV